MNAIVTSPFPIPQFISIKPDELTIALNNLVIDINNAIVQSGGGAGATGVVTRHSLFLALNSQGVLSTVSTAINALAVTNPAWIEWNTALSCALNDPLATVIASTLSYNAQQMAALWALAAQQTP